MRALGNLVGALALILGIAMLVSAVTTPFSYSLTTASAVQAIQVYVQAISYGVIAVGLFLIVLIVVIANNRNKQAV